MKSKFRLIFIILTTIYISMIQCMLSKPMRPSDTKQKQSIKGIKEDTEQKLLVLPENHYNSSFNRVYKHRIRTREFGGNYPHLIDYEVNDLHLIDMDGIPIVEAAKLENSGKK